MDFTGSGGRIVSDPLEAAAIAQTGGGSHIRSRLSGSRRPSSSLGPAPATGSGKNSEAREVDQNWFVPKVTREQANMTLFSHRAEEGVFLVRACSRDLAGYVLSMTTGGKVVHAQVISVSNKNTYCNIKTALECCFL